MHSNLINVAVIGYVGATGLALAYLVQRHDLVQDRSAEWSGHMARVRAGELGKDPADRRPVVRTASSGTRRSSVTSRAPRRPPAPKAAPVAEQTCPSCHLRKPIRQFRGEYCIDCAE